MSQSRIRWRGYKSITPENRRSDDIAMSSITTKSNALTVTGTGLDRAILNGDAEERRNDVIVEHPHQLSSFAEAVVTGVETIEFELRLGQCLHQPCILRWCWRNEINRKTRGSAGPFCDC